MSHATQILVMVGTAGQRQVHTFTLGAESARHRDELRHLLTLDALDAIEADGCDHAVEIDADELTAALRNASSIIDMIDDEGLRRPVAEFRDFWFMNHQKPVTAFAQLA